MEIQNFENRKSQYLNRRRLEIVSQTPNEIIADIYREEGIVEAEGTPINATTLNAFKEELADWKNLVTTNGTVTYIGENKAGEVSFTSEPQAQIDNKVNVDASNLTGYNITTWKNKLGVIPKANTFAEELRLASRNIFKGIFYTGEFDSVTEVEIGPDIYMVNTFNAPWPGFRISKSNNSYTFSHDYNANYGNSGLKDIIFRGLKPNTKYSISYKIDSWDNISQDFCAILGLGLMNLTIGDRHGTTVTSNDAGEILLRIDISWDAERTGSVTISDIQLEEAEHYSNYTALKNDRVIESWISSDCLSWYRIWSSGWKECGVTIKSSTTTSTYTSITLPVDFVTTDYTVVGSVENSSRQTALRCRIDSKNTVSVSAGVQGGGYYSSIIKIYCCGY